MSASTSDTYFTGCNVHVRDGSGDTDGETNGLGNLIVGYDEAYVLGSRRTGSHNFVIGSEHSYTSYGGIVAGFYNTVSAPYASVTGGAFNTASMNRAVVGGGERNRAAALAGVVVGGTDNVAAGEHAFVAGGAGNAARGKQAAIVGGAMKSAPGTAALVAGGSGNRAEGLCASVAGGELNQALAANAVVTGGSYNRASGKRSSVTGGVRLSSTGDDTSVRGAGVSHTDAPDAEHAPATVRGGQEAWAESIRRPEQTAGAGAAIRDAEVEPAWYGDNPFKLEGRDFNPRVGDPLAE
ncbi:MAG: hypothetical protein E4H03_06015 [Myxococcales bacterium]|nr:MAG: hypothetical protein E4H03_06015 [Myxococcales bacterium]